MRGIRNIPRQQPSCPVLLSERAVEAHPTGKFFPIRRKKFPINTRYRNGYENVSCNPNREPKHYQTTRVETLDRRHLLIVGAAVYKGDRFAKESILDVRTPLKPTETFQYTHYRSCHPPGVTKGFLNGETLRLLRRNSSKTTFKESWPSDQKQKLTNRSWLSSHIIMWWLSNKGTLRYFDPLGATQIILRDLTLVGIVTFTIFHWVLPTPFEDSNPDMDALTNTKDDECFEDKP